MIGKSYVVAFFGHRNITGMIEIENKLKKIIIEIIRTHDSVDFIVGRDGDFDIIAASVVKLVQRDYRADNNRLIWIMPYAKADFYHNKENYLNYYDEIEICEESAHTHPKGAIQKRNKNMVDRADLVICGVKENHGGAYQTIRYALKSGKRIENVM